MFRTLLLGVVMLLSKMSYATGIDFTGGNFGLNIPHFNATLESNGFGSFRDEGHTHDIEFKTIGFGLNYGDHFSIWYFNLESIALLPQYSMGLTKSAEINGTFHKINMGFGLSRGLININALATLGSISLDLELTRAQDQSTADDPYFTDDTATSSFRGEALTIGTEIDIYFLAYTHFQIGTRIGKYETMADLKWNSSTEGPIPGHHGKGNFVSLRFGYWIQNKRG